MKDIIALYYEKDLDYRPSIGRVRRILELVEGSLEGKKILDVGCAGGELGGEFKKRGAHVAGFDISETLAQKAKKLLDEVYVVDLEGDMWPTISDPFDIIIASEIIEHLFDPKEFLRKLSSFLKKGGTLIITTPNFLVWTNRMRMLFGKFEYTNSGFLDRGHIHFYTYRTLISDLKEVGYSVQKENHLIHPRIPKFLGRVFPSLFAYQFIIRISTDDNGK